jgi:hypothetical protein
VIDEFGLVRVDATDSLVHQQRMREIVRPHLEGAMLANIGA